MIKLYRELVEILVSLEKCESYEYSKVKSAVEKSFKNLGGIEKFIKKGENVLLKSNLVMRKLPEEAATTHPAVIQALAETLIKYGANVEIGDSPGGPFNEILLKSIYKHTGMEEAAEKSGAKLSLDTTSQTVDNPNGVRLKKLTLTNMVLKADKVISVGKLKTHSMTRMTGAAKNLFGAIPGTTKAEYHFNCQDTDSFAQCLADICTFVNPVLSFIDAVTGMEGNGPTAGNPRDIGLIMASENPFELDLAGAKIINTPPMEIPLLKCAIGRGLCSSSAEDIEFIGENINHYVIDDFAVPENHSLHFLGGNPPEFLVNFFKLHVYPRPVFTNRCVGCGICAENCPAKIITIKNKHAHVDLKKCIRCYCCQELCPHKAVDIKQPHILKLLSRM